ncbi:hypothetical protein Tco_0574174 [Tanacetum coccineum]
MEEILGKFIEEGNKEYEEMETFIRELQTTNEFLLKEQNNLLSKLRIENKPQEAEQEKEGLDPSTQTLEPHINPRPPGIPFPNRLRKEKEEAQQRKFLENLKQLHINIPFTKALVQMPKYPKYIKGLLTNKSRLEEACTITMNERCSALLLNRLSSKENDPGSFTLPCQVSNLRIDNALADLVASISLMPYTMYKKLGLGEPKPTRMSL